MSTEAIRARAKVDNKRHRSQSEEVPRVSKMDKATNDQEKIENISDEDLSGVTGGADVNVGSGQTYVVKPGSNIGKLTGDKGSKIVFG
jgi:hypothetical protein